VKALEEAMGASKMKIWAMRQADGIIVKQGKRQQE
jgi:hypothetical protein